MSTTSRRVVGGVIGWREWVSLPGLGVGRVKARIDTGARMSSLHAFDLEVFERNGSEWARFEIHPVQRSARGAIEAEAPLAGWRDIPSASGTTERRPVILTLVALGDAEWPIELVLSSWGDMGFRLVLGEQAVERRFAVDPARSYLAVPE